MKSVALLLALVLARLTCPGQTLFFDEMAGHRWAVAEFSTLEALQQASTIYFYVNRFHPDLVDTTGTTCVFGSQLLIQQYDPRRGRVTTVAAYPYRADRAHGTLTIFFDGKTPVTYAAGVSSTGNVTLLHRKRKQKQPAS